MVIAWLYIMVLAPSGPGVNRWHWGRVNYAHKTGGRGKCCFTVHCNMGNGEQMEKQLIKCTDNFYFVSKRILVKSEDLYIKLHPFSNSRCEIIQNVCSFVTWDTYVFGVIRVSGKWNYWISHHSFRGIVVSWNYIFYILVTKNCKNEQETSVSTKYALFIQILETTLIPRNFGKCPNSAPNCIHGHMW